MTVPTTPAPYSVSAFDAACQHAMAVQRREGWWLAGASLLLAVPLLFTIRGLEGRMTRTSHLVVTVALFLGYLGAMGVMLLITRVRIERARPRCPHCGVTLDPLAARVAIDTGLCNSCGERVIE